MSAAGKGAAAESAPADSRYVVVDGRRWRATDPGIPDGLRAELVAELMSSRRAVRAREEGARDRVQDAKVALGERGEPWWEGSSDAGRADRIAATIRALLRHRDESSTICPSDAARVVAGDRFRTVMDDARQVGAQLAAAGVVRVTQKGEDVDVLTVKGPVRIARGPRWPGSNGQGSS